MSTKEKMNYRKIDIECCGNCRNIRRFGLWDYVCKCCDENEILYKGSESGEDTFNEAYFRTCDLYESNIIKEKK